MEESRDVTGALLSACLIFIGAMLKFEPSFVDWTFLSIGMAAMFIACFLVAGSKFKNVVLQNQHEQSN